MTRSHAAGDRAAEDLTEHWQPREWWADRAVEGAGGLAERGARRVWQAVVQGSWRERVGR